MADRSRIEWTDATWCPIVAIRKDDGKVGFHCEKVSPACEHCYAETFNKRRLPARGTGLPYTRSSRDKVTIAIDEPTLLKPLKWRKLRRIFVESTSDLFADFVPFEMIDSVFAVMSLCPQHTFQLLTKRPDRMAEWFAHEHRDTIIDAQAFLIKTEGHIGDYHRDFYAFPITRLPLPNVWLGATVEDQPRADERIPHLLRCPAAVRFLSAEPLLGPIDLNNTIQTALKAMGIEYAGKVNGLGGKPFIHQVIVGGESGHGARPMHPDWARSLRDQCKYSGMAFFMKQWGEYCPVREWICREKISNQFSWRAQLHNGSEIQREPDHVWHYEEHDPKNDSEYAAYRVGKKAAGRQLDGVEHNEFPSAYGSRTMTCEWCGKELTAFNMAEETVCNDCAFDDAEIDRELMQQEHPER